ncbi:hypothetical protein F5Y05DRAFT_400036 [Hypoxylon sp. FL0543]|nr:hypothetical protein F5Y05DRAFT_400036 [Hypoxylon sp. FL0543]
MMHLSAGANREEAKSAREPANNMNVEDEELYQDVVSQFPFLNGYTNLVYGFRLASDTSRDAVVTAIRAAVDKITDQIPWLSHQVIAVSRGPGTSDILKLAPWPADSPANEIVRVKDCDELVPSMAQLSSAGVPVGMLDGKILAPWPSLPQHHGIVGPVPVIALQANFIRGGLILNFSAHHTIIDGTGIAQLARLVALALNGDEIPASYIEQANRDRSRVVPLIPHGDPVKDHDYLRRPPDWVPSAPASPPKWCAFKLPVPALTALMKLAYSPSQLVSENDVICAFYWQRLSAVRLARGFSADTVTKFSRTIDGRGAVGVPFSYMGHLVYHASVRLAMGQVASAPLSTVAQALRRELHATNTTWAVRSYATFLAREPDKSCLLYGGVHNPNTDIGSTSTIISVGDSLNTSSTMPAAWGPLLGGVRFLRRASVTPIPGSFSFSTIENGAIPIGVCLPEEDLEGLKKDQAWKQYMRYIG